MKKKIAVLAGLMMVIGFAFAACGGGSSSNQDLSGSKYVGTWKASTFALGDETGAADEGGEWTMTLNGDGTGKFVSVENGGEPETTDITWELTDEGFRTKGDTKLKFTDEGDNIRTKLLGVDIIFTRAGEEGPDDGAPDIGTKYGYMGQDPAECAVWKYMAEDIASQYGPDDKEGVISVPVIQIVKKDEDNEDGEVDFYGDFWVYNYVVEGDTLKCVSGGSHPGKMEVVKSGDEYVVREFEPVLDGGSFESSARDIFEENYDDFMKVNGDSDAREKLRAQGLADYVKTNGLPVTKYQDEGWDPVELAL